MSKTKRTLIISSCIMALAFVVAVVSVSAAWFGDIKSARDDGFIISSDTLQDMASIDINSSLGMSGERIYPAVAINGYFTGINPPTRSVLKNKIDGISKEAQVATVYFPIQFIGTPDDGYEIENRKSLELQLLSAHLSDDESETPFDFIEEFNVDMCLVSAELDEDGKFKSEKAIVPTAEEYETLKGGNVFYDSYGYHLYMLLHPGVTYYVKVQIYFNKIDEECNPDLLNTVIKFNFKLNILADGTVIREAQYKGGAAND